MSSILMHFRPEERIFVERAQDWVRRAGQQHQAILTPFLDPREQWIVQTLVNRDPEVDCSAEGGYRNAERCRMILHPAYLSVAFEDFQLAFFRLKSKSGRQLEHREVLGALLSLGIKRETVGDLLPHQEGCDVILSEEIAFYVRSQLSRVGSERVELQEIPPKELIMTERQLCERLVTVSSMRLDAIVAEGYNLSRSRASALIKNGKCKVNWKIADQISEEVKEGDLISLRGYGRIYIQKVEGKTKKGRKLVKITSFI